MVRSMFGRGPMDDDEEHTERPSRTPPALPERERETAWMERMRDDCEARRDPSEVRRVLRWLLAQYEQTVPAAAPEPMPLATRRHR